MDSSLDRSRSGNRAASPAPSDIRAARKAAGLTQTEAGQIVYSALRTWQDWEAGTSPMHPGLWRLFRIELALKKNASTAHFPID